MPAALTLLLSCGGGDGAPTEPRGDQPRATTNGPTGVVMGGTYTDARSWIEYQPGDAPLVIIAPHGGLLAPSELPDRTCAVCVTGNDTNTQDLARAVIDAFLRRTGARPHLVVNRLHRRKFDGNREQAEATGGNAALAPAWSWLQAAIDTASGRVATRHARGLVIDLHGHGHAIPRLELGYLVSAAELRRSDAVIDAGVEIAGSSIARLGGDARGGERGAALLRGPNSLGGLLQAAGVPSVPSPAAPAPLAGEEFFDGGHNTARNGSLNGGRLDAIQIETHFAGVRDTAASRERFATALANALALYLERHYGWRGPGSP